MLSPVEEIKSRLDIVEFIQGYVRLQKAGANFRANCPFHGEKTPSFFVTPSRQIWHCFGCGKGGDIFQFVMEMEGHDFPEALKLLAVRAGVNITREDPRIRSERNRLYDINEEAAKIFQQCFTETPEAKVYAAKRGLSSETLAKFRMGFAPQSWDFVTNALVKKGFKKEEIEHAGLAIRNEQKGSWYDRFRSRIMFPITDSSGRVIGFGGRIVAFTSDIPGEQGRYSTPKNPEDGEPSFAPPSSKTSADRQATEGQPSFAKTTEGQAKYINTPQTMIYDKSSVLYGFDKAKQDIRVENRVVLVEGYMDCVMSHQAGVVHTVAVSGTALTVRQLQTLRRLCDTMICSFDTDAAGESATRRSLALASEFDFERKVAHIHTGKDPADAVLENPELWREAVAQAKPVVEFYVEKAFSEHDPATAAGKKAIAAMVLPFVADVFDAIQRDHWIKELSRRLDVGEASIRSELERRSTHDADAPDRIINSTPGLEAVPRVRGRRELLEEKFLILLARTPEDLRAQALNDHHIIFASAENQNLFAMITTQSGRSSKEKDTAPDSAHNLEMFAFKSEILSSDIEDIQEEFLICKRELEKECIKQQMEERQQEISRNEKEGNHEQVAVLLKDINNLHKLLRQLSPT